MKVRIACEYSRLSFASATTCETRRQTSAIHRQKFHTNDVEMLKLEMLANLAKRQTIFSRCLSLKSNIRWKIH